MSRYWLFKTEPGAFSFDDLQKAPKQTTHWDGVRNYQARNLLRDAIKVGDGVFFYHSSVTPQVIPGTARVVRSSYPDFTQFDPKSGHYDPDSPKDHPRWFMVDIQFDQEFVKPVTLNDLRQTKGLENMLVLKRGMRLSIQPVTAAEWGVIEALRQKQ